MEHCPGLAAHVGSHDGRHSGRKRCHERPPRARVRPGRPASARGPEHFWEPHDGTWSRESPSWWSGAKAQFLGDRSGEAGARGGQSKGTHLSTLRQLCPASCSDSLSRNWGLGVTGKAVNGTASAILHGMSRGLRRALKASSPPASDLETCHRLLPLCVCPKPLLTFKIVQPAMVTWPLRTPAFEDRMPDVSDWFLLT